MTPMALITPQLPKKYKSKFEEQSQPHYSIQTLEKRPRHWGENIICLANLASHIIIHKLIRLSIMCLQEDRSTSPESTALGALWKSHSCDLELG